MSAEESFSSAIASNEFAIMRVTIRSQQISGISIGTGNQQCWYTKNVGSQTGSDQLLNRFLSRYQNFTAHMTTFLHGCQLIFEMYAGSTRLNHSLHQFERIQYTTKTGFRICYNRQEIVGITFATRLNIIRPLNLICATETVIDTFNHCGNGVNRVQRLIRVHA
ncbi:Uncharacterised protein [Yersinia enterocolitica]|nr:Uncharacterised protein [Yersinia enterocolitica]